MTDDDDPHPVERLRRLIEALGNLDDEGAFRVEGEVDVGVGLDEILDDLPESGGPKRTRHPRFGGGSGDRERDDATTIDAGELADDDARYHVDLLRNDDHVEFRADLPGVGEDEVSVAVEDGDVLLTVDGDVVERAPTAWEAGTVTSIDFNNGVLVVRLEPGGDEGGDGDE